MRTRSGAFGSKNSSPDSSPDPSPAKEPFTTCTSTRRYQRSSRTQKLRRNSNSVDEEVDKALVDILLGPRRLLKFVDICRDKEFIFGYPNSQKRKSVIHRRGYLLALQEKDPEAFLDLAKAFGLVESNSSPQTPPQEELLDYPPLASPPAQRKKTNRPPTPLVAVISPPNLLSRVPQTPRRILNSSMASSHGTTRSKSFPCS